MKRLIVSVILFVCVFIATILPATTVLAADRVQTAGECGKDSTFLGMPTWYKNLPFDDKCNIEFTEQITVACANPADGQTCVNDKFDYGVIWGILFAVIEMLLMLAGLVAVVFVIVGGFKFVVNQGSSERVAQGRKTIANALVGALIAIVSSKVVGFIAGRWSAGGTQKNTYGLLDVTSEGMLMEIFNIALTVLGALSVLALTITGIQFLTSGGNPEKVKKAREGIYYSLLGIAVVVLATALTNFIIGRLAD